MLRFAKHHDSIKIIGNVAQHRETWALLFKAHSQLRDLTPPKVDLSGPLPEPGALITTWRYGHRDIPVTVILAEPGEPVCTVLPDRSTYMRDVPADLVAFEVA